VDDDNDDTDDDTVSVDDTTAVVVAAVDGSTLLEGASFPPGLVAGKSSTPLRGGKLATLISMIAFSR
jgi:hypothetical protein